MNKMMKTVLCALCLVLGAWGALAATKTVTWTLPSDWEGRLELDQICEPVGAPSVAYYNALIEVPSTATNFVITMSDMAYRASELGRPAPVLEPSVIGEPLNAPVEDAALYAGVYPSDVFEKGEPWEMGGKTVLPVRIKVYRWNGPENKVEALSSLKLSIACESPRATLKLTTSAVPTAKVDYIVISPHNFVSYWQKFVEYRRTTHPNMTFEIVDANDIYNQYSGHDDALKIHHFIEAMYALGTRYILLGAGAQHTSYDRNSMIMTRMVITDKSRTQSADYYYCVVDKIGQEVWDYDGDQTYLASKNSSGGYAADAAWKVSWTGKMMVHRFPARTTVTMGGKTRSAQQQIEGYVEKLKRYEQGLFPGRFSQAIIANTLSEQYNRYHGNTSAECTQERQFYDLGANMFSEEHGSTIALNEYELRERTPSYFTLKRPVGYNRSVLQRYYSNGETASTFYGRNFDTMAINSHGSPEVVEPLTREGVFNASGLCGFHILILPCHAGNPCSGDNNVVSISEAGVVNPEGGSLASFGNSNTGLWGGKDAYSEKIERDFIKMLYACQDGNYNDAGTSRLWAMNNYKWNNLSPNSAGGLLMCDSMAYGDPLVKLSPIWSRTVQSDGLWYRNDQMSTPSDQEFASGLTINAGSDDNTITITNAIGCAYLTVNGTAGKTLTLAASGSGKFKVSNSVTVNNGMTLNWDVPGGFGRNGINLAAGGNLRLRAEGYYGIDFKGIGTLTVAPPANKTAIVDFDSKNYFRDGSGKFTALQVQGPGETIFRSRQAGIFNTTFNIPVTGGTLTLETPCVGGSGQQTSTTPLFKVSNGATLKVRPNPNWSAECFSRRVTFENGNLNSAYDKFYLGPNASGYPGLDITVNDANNVFAGIYPIRLNGQLRIHTESNGVLNATAEFSNGNGTGSIALDSGVTLKLAKSNSFSGGVMVPKGARLVVDNAGGLGTGSVVVQSGGILQLNAMPLTGVKSVTLQSGAKLVLKSTGSGSYQMYSPATTSFTLADGVKVYDSSNEEVELDGIVTPEGAYFISDAAKYWGNVNGGKWKNDSSVLAWKKKGESNALAYADGDTVLFKNIDGETKATVPVDGNVAPGMMAFQNTDTAYDFTGSGTITVGSMATAGTTAFAPSIRATSQVSVGGKTTFANVTTPTLNVAGGGALNVSGKVTGIDTIGSIRFTANATGLPNWADKYSALQLSELQFFDGTGKMIIFPVNTVIKDSVGNTTTITAVNGSTYTFNNANTIKNLFDGSCTTYHTVGNSKTGPWSITINLSAPVEMFKTFKYGRGQSYYINDLFARLGSGYDYFPYANPYGWNMAAGDSESTLKTVYTKGAVYDGNSSSLSEAFTASQTATSTSKATVQNGGTLYLSGTYNVPVTVNAGATLAVTNTSKATFSGGKTWPTGTYSMTVDTRDAKKQAAWFQVTQNAGFSSAWQFQSDDETAIELRSGDLWVATAGVKAPPYSRTLSANGNWNTTDWVDGKTNKFDVAWGSATTKPTGSATLTVTGTNLTMSVDCGVNLDTLKVVTPTNCFPGTFTATGSSALGISALDFRDFNGKVIWNPPLASWGTHVYVGTNEVTIASMTSGKGNLQVSAGGMATVPEKFAGYDVDREALVRFTGTHNFAMSDIPTKGYLSFKNTTLSGGFQNAFISYVVEPGDTLTFTGTSDNYGARMSSSFDIRGGSVTINSNAASTWFGINGETSFVQTNGTFKCTANDTAMSASNSGFLVGYSSSKTENFEFDISGGRFELPNTYINFYGPVSFNLTSNGVAQAKGVYKGGSNKGTITVNTGATFELGSIGLVAGACDFNLYGGTLAGFENGAHTRSTVNLVGVGTLAAKTNTTFTIDAGTINTDGATLNIGNANYTGTVKLSEIPTGVTNITVSAGTWDMGELRPTNSILSRLDGKIAVELDDEELRKASTTGFEIIRLDPSVTEVSDKVQVVRADGTVVPANGIAKDGKLYLHISYVYPLIGYATEDGEWSNFGWVDSIGMPFTAEWTSAVTEIKLYNTNSIPVETTIPSGFTKFLTVVNSGNLTLNSSSTIQSILDNDSTGITYLNLTANNVKVGAETVIKKAGTGNLTLAAGKCAALWNNLTWGGTISGFSGTAKIKYMGDNTLTSLNYTSSGDGIVAYAQKVAISGDMAFANKLTRRFEDGIDATVTRFVMGNNATSGQTGQTFYQTGGKIVVTGTGTILGDSPTGTIPLLFSHWNNPVTYHLTGGELIATNGVDGSTYFGRDGVPCMYIGGGETRAVFRTNGLINDTRTAKNKNGSVLELKPNGVFEIGNKDFKLLNNAELRMSGGAFSAYQNADLQASKFTLTANTTSYLSATNGATLTVSKVPTGTGTLICNPTSGSKVVLKGGSWNDVKLGGEFTIYLTSAQDSATSDTPLFTPASATMDLSKVTVRKSDGTEIAGVVRRYNGKASFVPDSGYAMPAKATIVGDTNIWNVVWYDSSTPARSITKDNIHNCSEVWFEAASDATITVDTPKGLNSVRIFGDHSLSFIRKSAALTFASASIETDVTSASNAVVFTTANIAAGKTLALKYGADLGNVTGSGILSCDDFCPTYGNLTDATKWTGIARYIVNSHNYTGLDFSRMGNASSTIEMDGILTATSSAQSYLAQANCNIGTLLLSGSMTLNNGFSQDSGKTSTITYTFGKLLGGGSLTHTGSQTFAFSFTDASEFTGALSTAGAQIGIGSSATRSAGVIAIASAATIVDGKQWIATNGVKVQNGGTLNLAYPRTTQPTTSALTVEAGGALNIACDNPATTSFQITDTGKAITINGRITLNGKVLRKDAYTIANGAITLTGNSIGASVSINVGGGGTGGTTGMLIADANYAGVIPVKGSNWNQDGLRTDANAVDRTISNLKEVLADGSVITGPMKVRLLAKNTWSAKNHSTPTNGDAQMMFGYLDDGSCSTTGAGAGFYVDNIPYTTYDVYVYMGSDADSANPAFVQISAIDATGTKTRASSWGKSASTHDTVTLKENENYCKFTGCTGSSLKVIGAVNGNPLRGGLAAIQIFNTGTRVNTLTWNGDATGGTWDKTATSWSGSSSVAWNEVSDGINIAKFNGDTSLTLGEEVCPDVIDIEPNNTSQTYAGFIPQNEANKVTIATGMRLKDVSTFAADISGGNVNASGKGPATPRVTRVSDTEVSVQFQKVDDGWIKCVITTFKQDGDNIIAYANSAKYISASGHSIGEDLSSGNNGTVVTSDTAAGYGVKNIKLSMQSVGTLLVASAEKFGKAFIVTNGVLTVAAGTLTQDVTLGPSAKLNIVSTEIANEYVMTKGKVIGGTMENLLFNGSPLESGSWTLDLTNGKLKRVVKPGTTPFTYTIASSSPSPLAWTNQPWVASNWFYVRPEEWVTNTVAEADLTVEGGITNTLVANANIALDLFKIVNSGELHIISETMCNLSATTVDDSASSGATTLDFAPTNVMAGVDTILTESITGKLTVGAGNKATINGTAKTYEVSSGGEVRFEGDTTRSKLVSSDGAIVSYENASFDVGSAEYWKLKLLDGDFVTLNVADFINPIEVTGGELVLTNTASQTKIWYGGKNETAKAHSTMTITGGKVTVLSSGVGTETTNCGFLFGQTTYGPDPVLTVDGGEFDISGGRFTFWQHSVVNLANGGILRTKGVNKQAGDQSYLNINQGGVLELGELGITKADNQTLNIAMNGGTLRTVDTAEAKLPIVLTGANTFSAAENKTLTVSGLLSGAGSVVIGEEDWTGTVKFSITNSFTGGVTLAYGMLEVPTGALKGNVTIGAGTTLNVTGTTGGTEYAITDGNILLGDGATMANIKLNGQELPADEKWEIEGGKIKRRIITPPFHFNITQNGNWNEQAWYDSHDIVLRDYEVAEYSAKKPEITLNVQNESSLFITNELDLTSLAATGQKVTLDFSQLDGNALAEQATFLHPATNVFIKTTSAIMGSYDKTAPNLPTGYTGEFIADATGLRYIITAPRKGYDYVGTINEANTSFSAIDWEGGVTYTNNYQNTVKLKVAGFFTLTLDQNLELYTFTLEQLNVENPAYVTLASTGDFATAIANVASFDLSGADSVDTPVDFGDRIIAMPTYYLQLSSTYAGSLKNGYAFCGKNNAITATAFAGDRVTMAENGTLTGAFSIANGGKVYLSGSYDGSAATFDIGAGELYVSYGTSTIGTISGNDTEGTLTIYGGALTANVSGFKGTIALGGDEDRQTGALRLSGVAAGAVNVSTNGSLYLTRATLHQAEFQITTGTLTFPTEAKLYINNELIESSRITVEGGKIIVADNVPTEPFTFTIATSGTYDWTKLEWTGANGVRVTPEYWEDAVGNVQLSSANGVTATVNVDTNLTITAFELTGNAEVVLAAAGSHLGAVSGTGTIACNFWPEGDNAVGTLGANWTGTFKVNADSAEKKDWNFASYYNGANSTFAYLGTVSKGYFNKVQLVNYGVLDLIGNITFDNGYSAADDKTKACQYIYSKLTGDGTFYFNKASVTPIVWFKDVSTFRGTLQTLSNGYRLAIGASDAELPQSAMASGTLTVVGDTELTPSAKIIAPSGVLVTNATLTVNWGDNLKDSGLITVGGNATLKVHDNTLSNNVTIATGGTLDLLIEFTESANEFKITEGTLTNNGTILVNGKAIPNGWAVVGNKLVKQGLIFWIAQGNANWNDPGVWAYQDGTSATFQEGDVVNFTNAVASVTLTANVAPSAIVVASGANVTVNGNFTLGTPAITGAGTLAVNPGITADLTELVPVASLSGFTGTYHIKSGRIKYASAIAQAVTLKVTDGGQLWLTGGTWNNHFELSGHGRGSGANNVEYAALRVEGNQLGTSSSITFVEEDGYITPGIGSTNSYTVPSTLSGCGMMVYGSGEMYLSVPKTQAAGINGPVIINGCTVKFGDSYENDWNTQYKLGTSVEVKSGATLRLKLCQHGGEGVDTVNKSHFVTPVILNGGTLYDYDGSYCYDSVEVCADSTFRAGDWGKRQIFKSLSGTGRLTVTSHQDTIFGILGGTFTGSIYNNGNGKVTPRNNALANATLELTSGGQLSLIDATQTIGKLMGGGSVYANQNATLTLKGGSYTGVIQNTSGGVGSTKLGLTIDGDVVLSGANTYTGLTTINENAVLSCVAASGITVTFPGGIAGTGTLIAEGAGMVNLAGYRLTNDEGLMLANAGKIGFTLTTAETNGTAWVSFAKMLDDNVGNIALYNPDGSANETFLLPKSINGVLMARVKSDMPTPKYGYAFDGNLTAETGCTALSFGGESGDHYETSGHGQAYKFASGYTPYGANFAKPTGEGWTIATFAKPVATDHRVFWTLGDANDLFGLAVAPNRCVKVFKAADNTAHTTLLTSDPIDDFSLEYHLFVMTYDGTTLKLYVDGEAQGEGYTGTVAFPNNQKFQFGSIHGGPGNTGVSRGDDILLDEWRVYSEVLTDEQLVTLTDEFKPWRANAVEKGSVIFIASSNDWDPTKLPTTAGKATATSNVSFANNSSYLRQLMDGFDTVALVTDATAGTYIYGLHAINGGDGLGAITRNVYLAMNAGTAYLISGGEDAGYAKSNKTIPTGNLLTQLGGSAVVDYAFGAGHKGGWNGVTAEVKGDTGVTITDDAQVRGTVAGGWSSIHQAQPKVSGNTSVLVRNIQRYSAASTRLNDIADNYIIGGSVFIGNGGGGVITGNTSVTVDIDDSQSGTFVKNIIGGSWYNNSHDMTIGGSSSVYVSAPKTVSFTGTFYAGSYGDSAHSTVAGTATMMLKNANFNAATLKGGNATGAKSLTAYFDEDATFTPKAIDGFGTVKVGAKKGATVTLGTVFANQALTLEGGNFELKSASPITLSSLAFTDSPTLTIAPNKTDAAIKVTTGSVDLNGTTISLDPLYFRDIPEDDTSTYVLMSAPTIVTNGVSLGKGTWTLALENVDDKQVLKATRGKGFYFIIAKNELTEETHVEHDTDNTKQSISVDTKWLVAKTDLTEEDVKDVETVSDKLNDDGANGAKIYESYVLGLDPNDATSKPVVAPVQTADPEKVTFKVANIAINKSSGANNVTYKVYSSTELGGEKTLETETPVKVNEAVGIALPENGVRYYQIEVNVAPKQ